MGLFKRKSVPAELPELAMDDLESGNKEVHDYLKNEEAKKTSEVKPLSVSTTPPLSEKPKTELPAEKKEESSAPTSLPSKTEASTKPVLVKEKPLQNTSDTDSIEKPKPVILETKAPEEKVNPPVSEKSFSPDEKSFFGDLQKNLNEGISDFNEFESWYKDKFEKRDVIKDMKNYWEDQKTASIISVLGKNFQNKISDKISKLQELEKIWQTAYFELVEKEEEIKEQELELKDLLAEFVRVCKKKTDSEFTLKKTKFTNANSTVKQENSVSKKTNVSVKVTPEKKSVSPALSKTPKVQDAKTKKTN